MQDKSNGESPPEPSTASWRHRLLQEQRWLTFLLPFVIYMLAGSLEPTPEKPGGDAIGLAIPYDHYPAVYGVKIALVIAAMVFVWPGYREFPLRVSPLAILVGVVGVFVWVGICALKVEQNVLLPLLERVKLDWLINEGTRPGFDPFKELAGNPLLAWGFLAVRFVGLAAVVPVIEEFFHRGFVMRFVIEKDWWKIPIGKVNTTAVVLATAIFVLMHLAELLAAAVWFSMVTWLLLRTRNIWDCVAAHAVTNLLLGVYVVVWGAWHLM